MPPAFIVHCYLLYSTLTDRDFYVAFAQTLRRKLMGSRQDDVPTPTLPPALPADAPHSDPRYSEQVPVDLVYTWVDGAEPAMKAQRKEWAKRCGVTLPDDIDALRTTDYGELKLSLRSAEAFLPWINRIYIVTNNQVPQWLDTAHPKIRVVNIDDLIPSADMLPVFNSHSVEFQLHRISGLSEHFIYCCDDMLFGIPCRKEDFFHFGPDGRGKPRLQYAPSHIRPYFLYYLPSQLYHLHYFAAWANLRYVLEHRYPGRKANYHLLHQATPMTVSMMAKAAKDFPGHYERVSRSRFRDTQDLPPIGFCSWMALLEGQAQPASYSSFYTHSVQALREHILSGQQSQLLCINNVSDSTDICAALAGIPAFGAPSPFEI